MSSAVAELDGILQSMLGLKSPGVSGSKINAITSLCNANVQSESVLIQKIYTHFKKTPGTHKLGVLYVVDSVTRQWVDQAKKSGQLPGSGAPDGTYAAGVTRVTELLPVLMNDIINTAPEDQKVKIKKLLEIWERSSTFPAAMLGPLKEKLDAPRQNTSTTPIGSPRPGFVPLGQQMASPAPAAAPQQDTSAILEALKNMAKQSATTLPAVNSPTTASISNFLGSQAGNLPAGSVNQAFAPNPGQAVNALGALFGGANNAVQSQPALNMPSNPLAAFLPPQQQAPAGASAVAPDVQTQLQLIQLMHAQGIPPDQWGTALQLLNMQNPNAGGVPAVPFPPVGSDNWSRPNGDMSRDGLIDPLHGQNRRRSRSPGNDRRREQSPRGRRGSPAYESYRGDARRGNEYRQRSPIGRRQDTPPQQSDPSLPPPGPRMIQWDKNMPNNHIKVLSRTLFVGGVTSSEAHLRGLFARFGIVQTCIVNVDKRHAFIKMLTRPDAEKARAGMEEYRDGNTQLRTKWGVGFGPRDCSDYQTGMSVIPVDRLTDADRKWLVSAEYGGTGGLDIQHGMIVEEPDIEIGAGVSSKAMSRRIPTDKGGQRGPQSSRTGEPIGNERGGRNRYRDDDRRNDSMNNTNGGNNNGAVNMPFPMGFPGMPNGMPMIPGFPFPFPQQNSQQ